MKRIILIVLFSLSFIIAGRSVSAVSVETDATVLFYDEKEEVDEQELPKTSFIQTDYYLEGGILIFLVATLFFINCSKKNE